MAPRVSIVLKSYNHASFVGDAIQSILDQSFQDFEIVVTDDASRDGSEHVIRRFADKRVNLVTFENNRGISSAMNNAISRASGEFIAILNSDDFALPGRLERQVAFLDSNPQVAGVFGIPKIVDEGGRPTRAFFDFTLPFSLPDFSRRSLLRHFFYHGNFLCAPTAMIRRSIYKEIGSYDPRLSNLQDFDMWVRLCTNHDINVMREELTAFRILDNARNMSAPRRDSILRSQFEAAQILRRFRAMNPEFLREIFNSDLLARGISAEGDHNHWLAELALVRNTPSHRLFALQTLYETAESDADFHRLRHVTGEIDLFGSLATLRQSRVR